MDYAATQIKVIFSHVGSGSVGNVEQLLSQMDDSVWQQLFLEELRTPYVIEHVIKNSKALVDLLAHSVVTISAFHLAALLGKPQFITCLISHGVEVETRLQNTGVTALHLAAFAGHVNVLNQLIGVFQADINVQDYNGRTALYFACIGGHLHTVRLLLDEGCDASIADNDAMSPVFCAEAYGYPDIARFIRTRGQQTVSQLLQKQTSLPASFVSSPEADVYSLANKRQPNVNATISGRSQATNASSKTSAQQATVSSSEYAQINLTPGKAKSIDRSQSQKFPEKSHSASLASQFTTLSVADSKSKTKMFGLVGKDTTPVSRPSVTIPEWDDNVRTVIRQELRDFFNDYMTPAEVKKPDDDDMVESIMSNDLNVIKAVLREELAKYRNHSSVRSDNFGSQSLPNQMTTTPLDSSDYQELPEIVKSPPPLPPLLPAVRPSNSKPEAAKLENREGGGRALVKATSRPFLSAISREPPTLLDLCCDKIILLAAPKWKILARALPLDKSSSRLEAKIKAIEKQNPLSLELQTVAALKDWQSSGGKLPPTVDTLIAALKDCKMYEAVTEVETLVALEQPVTTKL